MECAHFYQQALYASRMRSVHRVNACVASVQHVHRIRIAPSGLSAEMDLALHRLSARPLPARAPSVSLRPSDLSSLQGSCRIHSLRLRRAISMDSNHTAHLRQVWLVLQGKHPPDKQVQPLWLQLLEEQLEDSHGFDDESNGELLAASF